MASKTRSAPAPGHKVRPKRSAAAEKSPADIRSVSTPARSYDSIWICLLLVAVIFVAYAQVGQFEFLILDDMTDVVANPDVSHGLTAEGIASAFTSGEGSNWMPLTRLSHMLDFDVYGPRSGPHHLTNVLLHALVTILLFAFLDRATRKRRCSAFVAFVFALHPQHVESVAWIAERKDVLCGVFWFLTLLAYVLYAERPRLFRYLIVVLCFVLGLMAKPMMVTLPFIMLLLDVWPLRRFPSLHWVSTAGKEETNVHPISLKKAVQEKIPLFALAAASCVVTYLVQQHGGAVKVFYPVGERFENAAISYVAYIAQMFYPTQLAVFYSYPLQVLFWPAALSGIGILSVSVVVLLWFRAFPYLAVGWFWYLGTLVPVIGLVQVGMQARADRYMYLPMVGLLIMLAWGTADLLARWPRAKPVVIALTAAACLACVALTLHQTAYWKDGESLFRHALACTENNYLAHNNLGAELAMKPDRPQESAEQFEAALRLKPDYGEAHARLGLVLLNIPERLSDAIGHLTTALRIEANDAMVHYGLGLAFAKTPGRLRDAVTQYEWSLRIRPDYAEVHNNLGLALLRTGQLQGGFNHLETALQIRPDYREARSNLVAAHNNVAAALLKIRGRLPEAIRHFQAALRLDPDNADLHYNLGAILANAPGRLPEAINHLETSMRLQPSQLTRETLDRLRAAQAQPAAQSLAR